MKFRDLLADEIECRIKKFSSDQSGNATGAIVLLYKTARVDFNLLDEVVTPEMWQCDFREVKGNMYCTIRIWNNELQQWIGKENCGIESRDDGEGNEKKGEASDAFKRAGFAWGIGRKLYTAPFVFVSADKIDIKTNSKGGFFTNDTLSVSSIDYNDTQITSLIIINDKSKKEVYRYSQSKTQTITQDELKPEPPKEEPPKKPPYSIPCPVCGKTVTPAFSPKLNREVSAQEQIDGAGGMCAECFIKKKAEKK